MSTGEVTSDFAGVAQASDLSRQSEHLSGEVHRFLATVGAA